MWCAYWIERPFESTVKGWWWMGVTVVWRNINWYCQQLSLNLQRTFASYYKQFKRTPANANRSSIDCATERRTSQESEVGILFLRKLKMKERPVRRRKTLTVSQSVTIQKTLTVSQSVTIQKTLTVSQSVTIQKTQILTSKLWKTFSLKIRNHFFYHSLPTPQPLYKTYRMIQKKCTPNTQFNQLFSVSELVCHWISIARTEGISKQHIKNTCTKEI
jgi:hypothetical protein